VLKRIQNGKCIYIFVYIRRRSKGLTVLSDKLIVERDKESRCKRCSRNIQLNIERRQNYCFTNYSLGHTY